DGPPPAGRTHRGGRSEGQRRRGGRRTVGRGQVVGLWTWLQSLLFGERDDRPPTGLEDPRDTLDRAYGRQLELRAQVQEGLAAVTAAKKRVELQARQLDAGFGRLEERARRDLTQGHEEAARQTLLRRAVLRE